MKESVGASCAQLLVQSELSSLHVWTVAIQSVGRGWGTVLEARAF